MERLAEIAEKQYPKHGNVMMMFGDDLYFRDMTEPYRLILDTEEVMALINARSPSTHISIRWSTPSDYFHSLLNTSFPLHHYHGDFLPYLTKSELPEYWTGFYSLQPSFKRKVFRLSELTRLSEILSTAVLDKNMLHTQVNLLSHAEVLSGLQSTLLHDIYHETVDHVTAKTLAFIHSMVKSILKETEKPAFSGNSKPVLLYNGLNWLRNAVFKFESDTSFIEITDSNGNFIPSQAIFEPISLNYTIFFQTELPALSISIYSITKHPSNCQNCAHLSTLIDTNRLFGREFRLEFEGSGRIKAFAHTGVGKVGFAQEFYAVRSSIVAPYILAPGAIPTSHSLAKIALTTLYFQLLDGPVFQCAYSIWTYNNHTLSQLIVITKEIEIVHWEISGFPLENEDLFVGFESEMTGNEAPMYTFDGNQWKQRKYERPGMGFDIGRNFYPVSGAVSLGKVLIFIPSHPLGVGVHEGVYLFHLQRGEIHGEHEGFVHHFVVTTHNKGSLWRRTYYEGKQFNQVLFVGETLTGEEQESQEWNRQTRFWLGLDSGEFYISSLVTHASRTTLRVDYFSDEVTTVTWTGVQIGPEMSATGYQPRLAPNLDYTKLPLLCFKDCSQGATVAVPGGDLHSLFTPFVTYSVQVLAPLYHNITATKSIFDVESNGNATETVQENEPEIPAEATNEEKAVYDPLTVEEVPEEEVRLPELKASQEDFLSLTIGASEGDIEALEYCVVVSLGVVVVLCLGLYFRRSKRRRD